MAKRQASKFAKCVGKEMKGAKHAKLPEGKGGMHDKSFQNKFKAAVIVCKRK